MTEGIYKLPPVQYAAVANGARTAYRIIPARNNPTSPQPPLVMHIVSLSPQYSARAYHYSPHTSLHLF